MKNATMSSMEIAEISGRLHKNVLDAIRSMEPTWQKVTGLKFKLSEYKDATGRKLPLYELTMRETLYISTKFNDEVRAKLVVRWFELEQKNAEMLAPVAGIDPIIHGGKIGIPRRELFIKSGYSPNSGTVSMLKKKYPEHFYMVCRVACVSPEFAKLRYEQGKVRQLEINFRETGKLNPKGVSQ